MIIKKCLFLALFAMLLGGSNIGCTPTEEKGNTKGDGASTPESVKAGSNEHGSTPKTTNRSQRPAAPRVKTQLTMPRIYMSEQYKKSCFVNQGDTFPAMELPDTTGQAKKLSDLFGDRLTVVCFWVASSPIAKWQLADLGPDIVDVYGKKGVNVVAINYKDSVDAATQAAKAANATFPILRDEDGSAFSQIANDYLPRTYLLDADGDILWFDADYTSETRRDLDQAIRYSLNVSANETASSARN